MISADKDTELAFAQEDVYLRRKMVSFSIFYTDRNQDGDAIRFNYFNECHSKYRGRVYMKVSFSSSR